MGNFSQTIGRRLRQAARPASAGTASPHQQMIALPDGRKFWATRVPRNEWADLQPGHELLLVRASQYPAAVGMATVAENKLRHPAAPSLAVLWGAPPSEGRDTRAATVLRLDELSTILRYELRETGCPDVVATILPTSN